MVNILELNDQTMVEVWCELNRWNWPKVLGNRPKGFSKLNHQEQMKVIWPIMEQIAKIVGEKALLREWNKDNMTNEEFELWYKTRSLD